MRGVFSPFLLPFSQSKKGRGGWRKRGWGTTSISYPPSLTSPILSALFWASCWKEREKDTGKQGGGKSSQLRSTSS